MDQAPPMGGPEGIRERNRHVEELRAAHAGDEISERGPLDELHRDEVIVSCSFH